MRSRHRLSTSFRSAIMVGLLACTLTAAGCGGVTTGAASPDGSASPTPSTPTRTPTSTPTPTATAATPTATPTPDPVDPGPPVEEEAVPVVVSHGQRICSDEEFSAVQRQGFGFYALEAGCAIATDPAQPLPTDVSQDIQRRLEAIGLDDPADNGNSGVNNGIAEQALLADIQSTGKGAITLRLRRMAVPHGDGTFGGFRWVASAGVGWWWMQWERDRDVLRQNVDAWISENTTPGSWVVFVGPGEQVSPLP